MRMRSGSDYQSDLHTSSFQVLRFGRSHYGFKGKIKTTGIVGKNYVFSRVFVMYFCVQN